MRLFLRLVVSFLILLTAAGALAQETTLSVRVLDPQGAIVSSAGVQVTRRGDQWSLRARVDGDGTYRFESLSPGVYFVQAEASGFARSVAHRVRLAAGAHEIVELSLALAAFEESVVVTSSTTAERLLDVSKSLSVVNADEIALRDEHSLPEALRTTPGLKVQQLGGPGSFTSIKTRGLRNEDTAILIDGARLRDVSAPQGDATAFLENLMSTDVGQVEILRGSGSSLYGTNAGGGVINIVTTTGSSQPRATLLAEGGGLGLFRGNAQTSGGVNDRFLYTVGVSHLNVSEGVDGDDAARNTSVQGRAIVKLSSNASVSARFYGVDASSNLNESPEAFGALPDGIVDAAPELGDGSGNFLPSQNDPDNVRETSFLSTLITYEQRANEGIGYSVRYHGLGTSRDFIDGPEGVSPFEPLGTSRSAFEGRTDTVTARADLEWGEYQLIDAGYEFERERFDSLNDAGDGTATSAVDVTQSSQTLFVQDQLRFGALSVAVSARAQFFSLNDPTFTPSDGAPYQGAVFDSPDNAITGDVSAIYSFAEGRSRLRAHIGNGYRAPSLFERFGASFSTFGYFSFGDPRLSPEKTSTFDVGLEQAFASDRARVTATYFRTRLSEIIIFDFSGAIDPSTDPWGRAGGYLSSDGGVSQGVELTASAASSFGLRVNGSYTFTDAEPPNALSEDQTQAFVVPRNQFSLVASQNIGERINVSFDIYVSGAYLAPVFDPATFGSRVYRFDSFAKADIVGSYRLPLADSSLRLFLKVENLLDTEIFESGFGTPGRYALAGAAFEF